MDNTAQALARIIASHTIENVQITHPNGGVVNTLTSPDTIVVDRNKKMTDTLGFEELCRAIMHGKEIEVFTNMAHSQWQKTLLGRDTPIKDVYRLFEVNLYRIKPQPVKKYQWILNRNGVFDMTGIKYTEEKARETWQSMVVGRHCGGIARAARDHPRLDPRWRRKCGSAKRRPSMRHGRGSGNWVLISPCACLRRCLERSDRQRKRKIRKIHLFAAQGNSN
jgi:hypothetical protein